MSTAPALSLHHAPTRVIRARIRMAPRQNRHANVRTLPLDGRLEPAGGILADISQDGAFISTAHAPPLDALLLLLVYLPRSRGGQSRRPTHLRLLARVIHHREKQGFGCRFLDLDSQQRLQVQRLVDAPSG